MEQAQRLDDVSRTLNVIINAKMTVARQKMDVVSMFPNVLQNRMVSMNQAVAHLGQMLNSLSYKSVLSRGYAIVRGENNQIISRADGAVPKSIEFADGVIQI
jgi:exodeoxyribonuclease VII large subunit